MGVSLGCIVGTGKALSSGVVVGLTVGLRGGALVGVFTALLVFFGGGVTAIVGAIVIAQSRPRGTTQHIVSSRKWEELSGLLHLPMRIVLHAYNDAKIARDHAVPKESTEASESSARMALLDKLAPETLLQILGYIAPAQRYTMREVDSRFNTLVRAIDDIGVACTKRMLSVSSKQIVLYNRADNESGHINPIFDFVQHHLFIGQKRSMQVCSLAPPVDADQMAHHVDRQDLYEGYTAPFVLQRRSLLDAQRPFVGDDTKIRQLQVSPMHRYRSELRLGSSFYFEENVVNPRRTAGRRVETAWGTKPLFFAQDAYLITNNATTGAPDLYRQPIWTTTPCLCHGCRIKLRRHLMPI